VEIAAGLKPIYEAEAKERLRTAAPGVRGGSPTPDLAEGKGEALEHAAKQVKGGDSFLPGHPERLFYQLQRLR